MQFVSASTLEINNVANASSAYLRNVNQAVRFVMLTTLLPFFFSLASCSKMDTVAPVADQSQSNGEAREAAGILYTDGFENKQISKFWAPELHTATAGQIITQQRRAGQQAMRFSWKPNQADGSNDMLHSELASPAVGVNEAPERWYGYSSYLPSASMGNDNQTVIISQWHGVPDAGGAHTVPPLCISLDPGNKLTLAYRASTKVITTTLQAPTSQKIIDLGNAQFDRWVDYVVHVKWDPTGKTGLVQIWQDGKLIVNEQGISIGFPESHKPYWKAGLYAWTGKSKYAEKVIYYDEVRIGDASANYDAVKPGLSDNSARARQN